MNVFYLFNGRIGTYWKTWVEIVVLGESAKCSPYIGANAKGLISLFTMCGRSADPRAMCKNCVILSNLFWYLC